MTTADPARARESESRDRVREQAGAIQRRALDMARDDDYRGYSKHDALNASWLESLAGWTKLSRLLAIQLVMRSPLHVRPLIGVTKARNAKGLSLFARAHLARYRMFGESGDGASALELLDWLVENPSGGYEWYGWGYPYPWQDVGFFAPRGFPNRVVTSFVVQALLDGYETLGEARLLHAAGRAVKFLLEAPRTLYEDEAHLCLSYVPSHEVDWIVMDVPALVGSAAARLAAHTGDDRMMGEAGRLIRYVVSKQTDYGAWYYAEPPKASHITHDNYHTGFILDAILEYGERARSEEFLTAYRRGLAYYREHLFEPSGAPRFMNHRRYPYDIHGAAQGIITFALAPERLGGDLDFSRKVLNWTIDNMYDPRSGWFYYQKRRFYRTPIRLLRWCQAWMARAIGCYLERAGGGP